MRKILVHLIIITALLCGSLLEAGEIYYYKDANGVAHFTDLPLTRQYRFHFFWGAGSGVSREQIRKLIEKYALHYGVDDKLIQALAHVESRCNPNAVSRAGAQGVMQIMPETQRDLGLTAPFDPASNVEAGVRYFKRMLDRFGDIRLALAAYNAGPGQVDRYKGVPPFPETRKYVQDVLSLYARLKPVNRM